MCCHGLLASSFIPFGTYSSHVASFLQSFQVLCRTGPHISPVALTRESGSCSSLEHVKPTLSTTTQRLPTFLITPYHVLLPAVHFAHCSHLPRRRLEHVPVFTAHESRRVAARYNCSSDALCAGAHYSIIVVVSSSAPRVSAGIRQSVWCCAAVSQRVVLCSSIFVCSVGAALPVRHLCFIVCAPIVAISRL